MRVFQVGPALADLPFLIGDEPLDELGHRRPLLGAGPGVLREIVCEVLLDELRDLLQRAQRALQHDVILGQHVGRHAELRLQDEAAQALKNEGAVKVLAYCTHPVLSGPAVERVNSSDLDALVVTDTIPLRDDAAASPRIRQLSVAEIMAETIRRISNDDSVSSLFID